MAITLRNTKGTALTHVELDANFTTLQDADLDSAEVTALAQAVHLNTLAGDSDIDFGANKILYSNNYAQLSDLPSAATYHGMFAHVHGEAKAYYAHGGAWIKLADYDDINAAYSNADVDTHLNQSNPTSGYVLSWDGADYAWVAQSGGGATTLSGLTDVSSSSPSTGQVLKWDGSEWGPASDLTSSGGSGISLTDLSVTTNAAGSAALSYNDGTGVFSYTPPDLSSYLTAETNDLSSAVTWANIPDANVPASAVTQHQAALSITESQISDLGSYVASGSSIDMNGTELIMDADGDTSFHANTDDEIDIRVKGADVGKFDSDGLIINSIRTSTAGTPTLTSSSNINMTVGGSVTVSGGGFRVASLTGTQRSALAAVNGEIIYNSSTNKLQTYENNAWTDVVPSGSTPGATFTLTANGSSNYVFAADSRFFPSVENDPVLYLRRGDTYTFVNNSGGSHPFQIRQSNGGAPWIIGVTNNGASSGNIVFTVPMSAPSTLYYQCTAHSSMGNTINIV